jgi:hypothetical protein
MISPRYAVPVAILLALALVPTAIHSYLGATTSDGLRTDAIPASLGAFSAQPTRRSAERVRETFASDDWIEREYVDGAGASVRLFVARSYDAKKLYHHPEIGVVRGTELERTKSRTLRVGNEDVPLKVLDASDGSGVVAYALLYDNRFVSDALRFQLVSSLELLVSGRKAMTLFLAFDPAADVSKPLETSAVARVIGDAVAAFRAQAPVITEHAPRG